MGLGGISIWQLLIILVIVLLIFGTKRLKNLGGDLGGAIKGFKEAVGSDENEKKDHRRHPCAVHDLCGRARLGRFLQPQLPASFVIRASAFRAGKS